MYGRLLLINLCNNMKVLIFAKEEIVSKKTTPPTQYVKCSAIGEDGIAVEIFTTKEKFEGFNLSADKIMSLSEVKDLFKSLQSADVEFNSQGRIVSLN